MRGHEAVAYFVLFSGHEAIACFALFCWPNNLINDITVAQKTAPMFAYLSKICLLYFNGLTNFYQYFYILNFIIIAFK